MAHQHTTHQHTISEAALNGWWVPASARLGGMSLPDDALPELGILLHHGTFVFGSDAGRFALDAAAHPTAIDFLATRGPNRGRLVPGIVEHAGGMLRVCLDLSGAERPRLFDAPPGTRQVLVTYRRAAPVRCGIDTEAVRGGWRELAG
jgi:uncharacterized protein (TIGR03067 family)